MKKIILSIIFLLLFSVKFYSQENTTINPVGVNHIITSKILKEKRQIQVYLPKNYALSNKKYPVIYLLDGQRFFLYGASLYQTFHQFNDTPEFIVVGVTNVEANRMGTFSAGQKEFTEFLESEVIELVNSTYRTSKKRLLFGWAYGGGFALETLMDKPALFDGYILSSPYPVSSKMKRFSEFLESNKQLSTSLYFVSDAEEIGVKGGTEELSSYLSNNQTKLRWTFKVLSGEEHRSTVYPALYHGIKDYFDYYGELTYKNLKEFYNAGGMPYVRGYYKKRSEMYAIPNEMSTFSKYSLTRLSIRANNLAQFEIFLKEFKEIEFIGSLRVNWACNIADFYSKNDKKQKALSLYQFLATKHPKSIRVYEGLGDLYKANGDKEKADEAYKKASDLKEEG